MQRLMYALLLPTLYQALQSNLRYSLLPKRLIIGKRLAQCLHPALPSGVHLKALETYEVIFKIIGTKWLAKDLFIYRWEINPDIFLCWIVLLWAINNVLICFWFSVQACFHCWAMQPWLSSLSCWLYMSAIICLSKGLCFPAYRLS